MPQRKPDAHACEFGQLIVGSECYVVPDFQRNYAWSRDKVEDLWQDLSSIRRSQETHFLGSMVFARSEDSRSIVIYDGQQRFATILLLLAALRDVLQQQVSLNREKVEGWKEEINRRLFSRDLSTLRTNPKLILNREDADFFERLITQGELGKPQRNSHKLIKGAYEWLKEQIEDRIRDERERFVEEILRAIAEQCIVIKILVTSDADAHTIFETLNDRGLELSVADLVKNWLFYLGKCNNALDKVRDEWGEIVNRIGDASVSRFLRHFWISKYELVRKETLYKKLKPEAQRNVVQFVEELRGDALVYSNLREPTPSFWDNDREIVRSIEELNIMGLEQVYVLLLAAYRRFFEREREKFKLILRAAANFSFRWSKICGRNPNEMERTYGELARKLRRGEIDETKVIERLYEMTPADTEFIENFKNLEPNRKMAKYILIRLNDYLLQRSGQGDLQARSEEVNLEHIIPQRPNEEWQNFFREKGIEDWRALIPKIGNLTILLEEYNREISNYFFTQKKKMYAQSHLPLTQKLATYEEFGRDQINERAERMAELANEIWNLQELTSI